MPAKLTFNGIEIAIPVGELGEALRQLGLAGRQAAPAAPAPAAAARVAPAEYELALGFLALVNDGPGAAAPAVQLVLGAKNPKGIGGKLMAVNNLLEKRFGILRGEAYEYERESGLWHAGPRLAEAIGALRKGINGAG